MGIDVRRALLHWAAYSAEARNPLRLPAFCVRACRSLGGVRRSNSVSGSCSTERGSLFHFLVVLSLTMSYCVTDGDEPAKAPEAKKKAEYGGVVVRLPLGLRSLTLLRCLSRHSSLVLCSCLTLQAMAPKAYLTGKSKDKVAAKKTRKKPGGPRLRRCWAELHGWRGWTLAQNQASLDWASSVDKQEKARVFKF